jgi:hypothetical protein
VPVGVTKANSYHDPTLDNPWCLMRPLTTSEIINESIGMCIVSHHLINTKFVLVSAVPGFSLRKLTHALPS